MENIRDWCISRQIWWGHRIPIWYCQDCPEVIASKTAPQRCPACGGTDLVQDEDVLDTWFSSWLWPFSTLGWPEQTPELDYFYPISFQNSGYDIIFFWVARMIMAGFEFMGELPFPEIYIHGMLGRRGEKPESGAIYVGDIEAECQRLGLGQFVSLIGRFWSLDREHNWDRIEKSYRWLVHGEGRSVPSTILSQ